MDVSSIVSDLSQNASGQSSTKLAEDFDTFLSLLTTQLQHQDPLDPLDSNDFTQQLVQFTGVEQAIATNKNLENLATLVAFQGTLNSATYIGKDVTVASDFAEYSDQPVRWFYELDNNVDSTKIRVLDDQGEEVVKLDGDRQEGLHSFVWDGVDQQGNPVAAGLYRLEVVTKTDEDADFASGIFIREQVDSVEFVGGEAFADLNGQLVPLTNILAVHTAEEVVIESAPEPETETEPTPENTGG